VVDSVKHVRLGDYVSLDDDITFDDLADALEKAWQDEALPIRPRSVDVLIHSTGALVVRHWMTRYHKAATNPIICHKTACVTASQRQAAAILTTSNYLTAPKTCRNHSLLAARTRRNFLL
jgi:alpha-beta hydrolase superfamily lysophospholipase